MRRTSVLLVAAATVLAGSLSPARADDAPHPVALTGFGGLVVDAAHGQVFLSQPSGPIVVTDLDGVTVGQVDGIDGAAGMTLDDDGSTLYVARPKAHEVDAVDTASLTVTATRSVWADWCPTSVAYTEAKIYFGSTCDGGEGVGWWDPEAGTALDALLGPVDSPLVATTPALPGVVLVGEGGSPGRVRLYDAADDGSLVLRAEQSVDQGVTDAAFTPDGTEVVVGAGRPAAYRTTDLARVRGYGGGTGEAVAVRSDGLLATGGGGRYGDVALFPAGSHERYRDYDLVSKTSDALRRRGLAFGRERLYAVTGDSVLHVIDVRDQSRTTMRVQRTARYGDRVEVEIGLDTPSADRDVTVYGRAPGASDWKPLTHGVVGAQGGVLSFRATSSMDLEARYAGDDRTDGSVASDSIEVRPVFAISVANAVRRSAGTSYVRSGDTANIVAKVGAAAPCATFRVEARRPRRGSFRPVFTSHCLSLQRHGRVVLKIGSKPHTGYLRLRVAAFVDKDERTLPGASRWVELQFCQGRIPCVEGG